jgi:hypothetical protein
MHEGAAPLLEEERTTWQNLQDRSDKEDEAILSARIRKTKVQGAVAAYK